MSRWLLVAGLTSLFCCFAPVGCGPAVRRTPESLDTEAKAFTPKAGRANIYVHRKIELLKSLGSLSILLNRERVGALSIGTYLLLSLAPGDYTLSVSAGGYNLSDPVIINAEANKNYFAVIDCGIDALLFDDKYNVKLVDESEGRKAVMGGARAQETLGYGQLQTHTPSDSEKTFQFVLKTEPCPARVIIEQSGTEQEIGMTPYLFKVGLAGRYEYWPIRREGVTSKEFIFLEYVLYPQEHPLVTVREIYSIYDAPVLDLKCKLVADGFEPQSVERVITFKSPCFPTGVESCFPDESEITVGLNRPTQPEYVVRVKIDSIPPGADIYTFSGQGYLGERLGTTPEEFEIGFANGRSPDTGTPNAFEWFIWRPNSEEGFVTYETPPCALLNFALLKDGYARQDVTRWTVHTPDVRKFHNVQKTITIPLKTHEEARQERMERIEKARIELAAALKSTELELKRTEISNQQQLIRQQELISKYLAQLNIAFQRVSTSSPGTIIVKQDPHYNREWQDSMEALGSIIRPHSKLSPVETEMNIKALEGLGSLIDLMNR